MLGRYLGRCVDGFHSHPALLACPPQLLVNASTLPSRAMFLEAYPLRTISDPRCQIKAT